MQPSRPSDVRAADGLGWHRLRLRDRAAVDGGVQGLAVSLLQDRVLAPVLGIEDPRRDPRLAFVGGPDGLAELDDAVAAGAAAAAFALAPTPLDDLVAVSDAAR